MNVTAVTDIGHGYMVMRDDGFGFMQRKGPKAATERPLDSSEKIICALCERVIWLDANVKNLLVCEQAVAETMSESGRGLGGE